MGTKGIIETTGLEERIKKLGLLSTRNPEMRRRINEVIRQTLTRVQKKLQGDARSGLQMQSDPRKAYKAVRKAVYRRIFGGQVNILNSRNAKKGTLYEPPRKLRAGQRGGNRMIRSARTTDLMSYDGKDRGFILRFLNAGTEDRYTGGRNGRTAIQRERFVTNHKGRGFRGKIAPRNWFGPRSQVEMESAAADIDKMIDDIITGIMY